MIKLAIYAIFTIILLAIPSGLAFVVYGAVYNSWVTVLGGAFLAWLGIYGTFKFMGLVLSQTIGRAAGGIQSDAARQVQEALDRIEERKAN